MTTHTPTNSRLRDALDWAILLTGVTSLAFAILASTTGLVSADDDAQTVIIQDL